MDRGNVTDAKFAIRGDLRQSALIVDNHELVANSLASILRSCGASATVLRVGCLTVDSAVEVVTAQCGDAVKPPLALIDLNLKPDLDGVDLIAPLTNAGAKVVVVSGVTDRIRLGRCIEAGAVALINKGLPFEEFGRAISRLVAGENVMAIWEKENLVAEYHYHERERRQRLATLSRLTHREAQVLAALVGGLVASEIAEDFCVSIATIRSEIRSILTKLAVHSQLEAIELTVGAEWRPDLIQHKSRGSTGKFHQPW